MKIITPRQMQKFDAEAQKYYAIAAKNLMHNAGCGIRKLVEEVIAVNNLTKNIVVFAGKGNNAGDAFCLINLLRKKEYTIKLFMTSAHRHYLQQQNISLIRSAHTHTT